MTAALGEGHICLAPGSRVSVGYDDCEADQRETGQVVDVISYIDHP